MLLPDNEPAARSLQPRTRFTACLSRSAGLTAPAAEDLSQLENVLR